MSKKAPVQTASDTFVIYDDTIKSDKGDVRLLVEVPKTKSRAELYLSALKEARSIPFDIDNINPTDKMYQYVYQNIPTMKGNPDTAKEKVRYFYERQVNDAYRDAVMLAIISDKSNKFNFEPDEITDEEWGVEDDLPGLLDTPKAERNLANPTERRLGQFYTILKHQPDLAFQFVAAFEKAVISMNELAVAENVTEEGFQPQPTR